MDAGISLLVTLAQPIPKQQTYAKQSVSAAEINRQHVWPREFRETSPRRVFRNLAIGGRGRVCDGFLDGLSEGNVWHV
jgi:hypothetical protein